MKKVLYSALAVTCAIAGVAASKANNSHRLSKDYKYIGTFPVSTVHQVTLTTNWTLVASLPTTCPGTIQACSVTTTIPQFTTVGRKIPSTPIPALNTVTGVNPRYTAAATNGVIAAFSKANQ